MDNAGCGQRGLRAAPSPELFKLLHDCYGIEASEDAVDLGGSSSLNLLVTNESRRYVLRVYRPYVTETRLRDVHLVRRELTENGVPCSEAVATGTGQPWVVLNGRLVELEHYVKRDADMDSWERLETALPILGRIHTILRNVEVGPDARRPLFANHIESHDALDRTLRGTRRIREWDPSPDELRLAGAAEELAHLVSSAERELVAALPRQLVHGDFWDDNVFFREGRVVLVTDFDFMGERARIDDLALTLFFTSLKYAEDPVSDDQLLRLRRLIDAYDSGLAEPLLNVEREALPFALARQPLWSIGGWVALLDDEQTARLHAAGTCWEIDWALRIMREVDRWQAAFA